MKQRDAAGAALLALLLAALAGCGGEDPKFIPFAPPTSGSLDAPHYLGFLGDGRQVAEFVVVIQSLSMAPPVPGRSPAVPSPTVPASGLLKWPGGDIVMSGVYDFTADTLYLTSTGREVRGVFVGNDQAGTFQGTATTPDGPAGFLAVRDSVADVTPWIGSFQAAAGADSGTIGFVRWDTHLVGQAFSAGASAGMYFDGSVTSTGTPKSLAFDGIVPTQFDISGTGNLDDSTGAASGDYDLSVSLPVYGPGGTGTWSATRR